MVFLNVVRTFTRGMIHELKTAKIQRIGTYIRLFPWYQCVAEQCQGFIDQDGQV
jgi:hypothetical protein